MSGLHEWGGASVLYSTHLHHLAADPLTLFVPFFEK